MKEAYWKVEVLDMLWHYIPIQKRLPKEDEEKICVWDEVRRCSDDEIGTVIDYSNSTGAFLVKFNDTMKWFARKEIEKTGRRREIG